MRKLMPLLLGAMLLLSFSTPGQEKKKPPTTLEEDWKTLCRFQWVNSDPKEAWALFPNDWKDSYTREGSKGWSRIELSFYERSGHYINARWYYLDPKGKEQTNPAFFGIKTHLQEEKGERFLLRGKAKIKYELKEGVLILNGVEDLGKDVDPFVYTGKYKGVERNDKK